MRKESEQRLIKSGSSCCNSFLDGYALVLVVGLLLTLIDRLPLAMTSTIVVKLQGRETDVYWLSYGFTRYRAAVLRCV